MSKEQKIWLTATIILFVLFMSVGWYFTVARALQKSFKATHVEISGQLSRTKETLIGKQDIGQKTQESVDKVKAVFQKAAQSLEKSKKAENAIIDNVKEELKKTSTN